MKASLKGFWAVVLLLIGTQLALAERTTTYLHTDGLGSVIAASDQGGNLLWRKSYAPFGEQIDTQSDNEKLSYTGKPHDDVTGLTYFGGRYYDPAIGRFASVDPVGFVESNPMSFNRYLYVNNNPYKYVDPDGEFLNFAAKFVLDVGVNIAFNYVTTGSLGVGSALKESATGILNPAKTVAKVGKLAKVLAKAEKRLPGPCKVRCFAAGTTILTDEGFVAIETLQVGDLVWAHDPDTGEKAFKPIVKTFVNTNDTIWSLTLVKNGESHRHQVTGSHPYYVPGAGWVEVAHLRLGTELLTEDGTSAVVTGVYDTGEIQPTYNLEVADINTYYVSAAKVLVHNCGGGGADPWVRTPSSLQDDMTLTAAKGGAGTPIITDLNDPKFKGMEKWEYRVKSAEGRDSVVHYVRDPKTNALMDFKFKKRSTDGLGNYEKTRDGGIQDKK